MVSEIKQRVDEDRDTILRTLIQQAVLLLGAKSGGVYEYDAKRRQLRLVADYRRAENVGKVLNIGEGMAGKLVQDHRPFMIVDDYDKWPGKATIYAAGRPFGAVIEVPLKWHDRILGVLYVDDEVGRKFTPKDADALSVFAHLAAIALVNVDLAAQLHEQKDNLARLIDSSPSGIIGIDGEGTVTVFSGQAQVVLGYRPEEVIGMPVAPLYADPQEPHRIGRLLREKADGKLTNYETFVRSKTGEHIPIRLTATWLLDSYGTRIGSVGYFEDLRSIKAAEQQIRFFHSLEAIHRAGQAVTSTLTLQETLNLIVEQASRLIGRKTEQQCFSHLVLVEGCILRFTAAYPSETLEALRATLGDVDLTRDAQIGIIGRAVKQGESQIVEDVRHDPDYRVFNPTIASELAVPIKVDGRVIGAINMEHPEHGAFGEHDRKALEVLAGYAAIAINNARLYAQSQVRRQRLEAIAQISREAAASLDTDNLLRTVCERLENIMPQRAISCIRLYNAQKRELYLESKWHDFPSALTIKRVQGRTVYSLDEGIGGWVATNIKLFKTGNVHALKGSPQYLQRSFIGPTIQSEICVPIYYKENKTLVGVLDIMSPLPDAFGDEDEELLTILADQLAVAIQNARSYQDLLDIRGYVGAYTATAWMKMVAETWAHRIRNRMWTALAYVKLLQEVLERAGVPSKAHQDLFQLEQEIRAIQDIPIVGPLSSDDAVTSIKINDLVQKYLERQWDHPKYKELALRLALYEPLDTFVRMRASPEWLRLALEILVDNAVQAMVGSPKKVLTATTRLVGEQVEISIRDTGPGLPKEVIDKNFEDRIIKPKDSRGSGVGLVLANTIVRAYQGRMYIATTGPEGTDIGECQ